ncbi:hypothetical protein DFH06DRAFT_436653 [Mycena polygramma]|nr:hypothetical protein DFH06DRAFT_436653 [Mycena polygramma]
MSFAPIPLTTISSATRAIFSPDGVCIIWDAHDLQLCKSSEGEAPEIVYEIKFTGEEILDVAVHDDELFVLTGIPTGTRWRRELRRYEYWDKDPWTKDRPLYSYSLRTFTIRQRSAIGPTLRLPDEGVKASIRAGKHTAIVKSIGPECYASVWRAPNGMGGQWNCLHKELSWDPDVIAKKLGFRDHFEEVAHIKATNDERAPSGSGWRNRYGDAEFFDYSFISDTLVLRVRYGGLDDDDSGVWSAQVLDMSTIDESGAPAVDTQSIPGTYIYRGITDAFINTPTTFSVDDWVSITLWGVEGAFQVFFCVFKLIETVKNPSKRPVDHVIRGTQEPFMRYAFQGLGPTLRREFAILPAFDVDRNSKLPVTSLRFLRFPAEGMAVEVLDVPFRSLFPGHYPDVPEIPPSERDNAPGLPQYVVAWDGRHTLCVVFRDGSRPVRPEERKHPAAWLVWLSRDDRVRLGLDACSSYRSK